MTAHNQDLHIEEAMLDRIFEYAVSDTEAVEAGEHCRQCLLLARTYSAKMRGTVVARNAADGAASELRLAAVNQGNRRST